MVPQWPLRFRDWWWWWWLQKPIYTLFKHCMKSEHDYMPCFLPLEWKVHQENIALFLSTVNCLVSFNWKQGLSPCVTKENIALFLSTVNCLAPFHWKQSLSHQRKCPIPFHCHLSSTIPLKTRFVTLCGKISPPPLCVSHSATVSICSLCCT